MAELFMECEEEELEPWQQKAKPIVVDDEDDEDDEPIFVGEFLNAKPTNTYILNRVNPSSSRVGMQNGVPKRGAVAVSPGFHGVSKPAASTLAVQPQPRVSSVSGASQVLQRPLSGCSSAQEGAPPASGISQPVSRSTTPQSALRNLHIPPTAQSVSRPVATVAAQPVALDRVTASKTSGLTLGVRQNSGGNPCQSGSPTNTTGLSKRPSTSEASSISAKKVKPNETGSERESSLLPLVKAANDSSLLQKDVASGNFKNGAPFPQACPKCNIHFNLLEPLKNHIKYCCPDMVGITKMDCSGAVSKIAEAETGKLIMLVNDFYYGKHEGNLQQVRQEKKTHTTFKCASCMKVLKSNIRFMNHMKHHLEAEKQNSESWESHTTCQHCYRQFPTPFQLQCHIESTHTPHESSTVCKICELSFETEQVLLQHMKDNHKPGEMPYVCQVCNYRSSVFSDVEKHFRAVHENTKNLLCPFCLKVIKIGAPYMHHFMRHQKKGVHRCTKCRLQFLTCKEKLDHKSQHHRTFKKPAQLEGLPPGTKVTIRASVGSLQPVSVTASPVSANASTLQLSPGVKVANPQNKLNASKAKSKFKLLSLQKQQLLGVGQNSSGSSTSSSGSSSGSGRKANKIANTALNNLRCPDIQKCIECDSDIRTFASHFPAYVHCSLCRYSTSCSKAYVNHMMRFHSARQSKRFWIYKTHSDELRDTTVVCLNCDFLTDVSGLDKMATHLNESHSHTCQVIMEEVLVPLDNGAAADLSDLAKDEEEKPEKCTESPMQAEASISGSPQARDSAKETKLDLPRKQNNEAVLADNEETKQLIPKSNFTPGVQASSNNSAGSVEVEGLGSQDMLVAGWEIKESPILENVSGPEPEACSKHCAEEGGADKLENQTPKDLLAVVGKGDIPLSAIENTSASDLHTCFTQDFANQESASLLVAEKEGTLHVPGVSCGLELASPKGPPVECLANRKDDNDAPDPELNTCSGEHTDSENTRDADHLTNENQSDVCPLVAKDEGNPPSGVEKLSALRLSASSNGPANSAGEPHEDKTEEENNPTFPAARCKENVLGAESSVAELQTAPKIFAAEKVRDPLGNQANVFEESSASSAVENVSASGLQESSAESSCEKSAPEDNKANADQSSDVQAKGADWDEAQLTDMNIETPELASNEEEVSFEQFLRRRGEPESAHSDASDQGSVHLEPLTPSEVLEHEATEILQKGSAPASTKKAGLSSEPADVPSGEGSPSQEEPSGSQAEEGEEAS